MDQNQDPRPHIVFRLALFFLSMPLFMSVVMLYAAQEVARAFPIMIISFFIPVSMEMEEMEQCMLGRAILSWCNLIN